MREARGVRRTPRALVVVAALAGIPGSPSPVAAQAGDPLADAEVLIASSRPGRALDVLEASKAQVAEASRAWWLTLRGWALTNLGRDADARISLDEALALEPGGRARLFRAVLHLHAGRTEEALADYDACKVIGARGVPSDRPPRIRFGIVGPYRERWPHAWRRLEYRKGHFDVVSRVGLADAELDAAERELASLDPAKPADKRKIDALLTPSATLKRTADVLEAAWREAHAMFELREKDWPAGRILKVIVLESEEELGAANQRMGTAYRQPCFDPENDVVVGYDWPEQPSGMGLGNGTTRSLLAYVASSAFAAHGIDLPHWLNAGVISCFKDSGFEWRGGRASFDVGHLVREAGDGAATHYQQAQALLEGGKHVPWRTYFAMTNEAWNKAASTDYVAEAWAIAYYFLKGRNADFRKRLIAAIADLRAGKDWWSVLPTHFPDDVLDKLETAWLEFMRKL